MGITLEVDKFFSVLISVVTAGRPHILSTDIILTTFWLSVNHTADIRMCQALVQLIVVLRLEPSILSMSN